MDVVRKEMAACWVAFKLLEDDANIPKGYQQVFGSHIVLDMKMEEFCHKERFCAGGNMTKLPSTITYARIVLHESVQIALTLAALKDLDVRTRNIQNA